jgi:hypothetical protein
MRFKTFIPIFLTLIIFGLAYPSAAKAEDENETGWIKYCSWKGQVKDLIILSIIREEMKVAFPVGTGFRNATIDFFAEDPQGDFVAKLDVVKSDGKVAVRKQFWQAPDRSIRVQIINEKEGWGDFEFTVYYREETLMPSEKIKYQAEVNTALYDYDVHQINYARSKNDLRDALRWARSAYEIDRLNWDILNIVGELHYLLNEKNSAEDVYIILRDHGHLTPENMERFKELNPYEASKKPASEIEEEEATEEVAVEDTENTGEEEKTE